MNPSSINIPGYELIRELGVGGMATVFLAIQRSLDRKVAIKVMKRNIDDLEKFERRFLIEGRTMAKLPHRNIVAVYDIVKNEDVTYIAMEFLEGGTLSGKMKEGLSLAEAISVVVQIGQALQFAHEHGIVHRDLKPANIMFREAATPVLTDFGIAKHQDAGATRLTQTGMLVGTPTYMSPEQINALDVDGRSDLYSLGILFYELLTGSPPFHADTPIAVLMAHLTTPPPSLPVGFADFQPVVDRMLAKNRDDRFPSLKEFTRALKGAVVNNQNLWHRLQSDPNQSSSEQLRALGFSAGGGDMQFSNSGQIRLPPSGKGAGRTPTPGPMSLQVPGVATGQMPQIPSKPPWLWIGIGGGIAALVLAAVLLWPKPDVDPAIKKLVDFSLVEVDRLISTKELVTANERLQLLVDQAPKYLAVRERVTKLVAAFKAEANEAAARGDFDTAFARIEQAKLIDETDPEIKGFADKIKQQRAAAEQNKALADVLKRVDAAIAQGRDLGAGGAYAILTEARAKAPDNAQIKQRLDAVIARALKPARDALNRNDLQTALASVQQVQAVLANEPDWQKLRADVDGAIDSQAARVRLAGILATIDQQIQAGKLVEPVDDNAQQTLARALTMDPKSADVLRRQVALAAALTNEAQQRLNAGQIEAALVSANEALNVKADYAQALALQKAASGRMDSTRTRVIQGLTDANQALAAQRFLSPPGNNARELLSGVLKLDPRNADAQNLLTLLPQRIADAAKKRAEGGDVAGASTLIVEARKAYPANLELAVIGSDLDKQLADQQARQDRGKRFDRISQLLAARPLKPENIGTAAKDIGALLAANPRDVDAATAKQRMFDTLTDMLRAASGSDELDNVAAALKQAQLQFATDPAAQALAATLDQTRQRVAAEEQTRLAAISGELVLNAYPWAMVESVVDANRNPIKLPLDATTPLRLRLPAGVYYVTFRHPQIGRTAQQVAQVQAQKSISTSASFSSSLTSKEYLKRAGW